MIACPSCGTQNEAGRRFCIECGTGLAAACPVCATINPPSAKFCGQCGTALAGGPPAPSIAASATVGSVPVTPITERRLVSVLFVDLVGFTTATEQRDADDTRELLSRYYETAREIVGRYGGVIEKFIGDAVMAVWGTPTAREDDAERAVRAAIDLVAAVPRLAPEGQALQARAGVLTGEAAVAIGATGQGMVAGDMVNTASRLQSVAAPGTVLVGEATYRAASQAIAFEDAGERELKGKEAPVHVWQALTVIAKRGGEGRSATLEPPFVGREDELLQLKDLFHATAREGKPRLVTISGVAGIGKSRLLWELEKYLDGVVESVFWHAGRSPSYGEGISYWSLAEMIRARAGIAETDDSATVRRQAREMLDRFVADEADRRWIEPRVLGLLAVEDLPGESRDELFAAWRTLFERMAAQSAVVLTFFDLQWADQGTLDFIEHILSWSRNSPIFVLGETRPELFERRPGWGRSVRSSTLLHLDPLPVSDMEALLLGLVPGLPRDALRQVVERAEGVPLYAVETIRMLIDNGTLEARGDRYALVGPLPELAVPETLHALIAARLDGLQTEERALITDGAVLGLSFTLPSLVAVSQQPADVVPRLVDGLVRRELLAFDVDPRSPERGQLRFLQAVVREIAYQSLAKKNRQARHLAAARYFEGLGEDELAAVTASHYLAAYQATAPGPEAQAVAGQARVALRAAAERATALHDLVGALAALENALLVTPDPLGQAALHERAIHVAGSAASFARSHEHAELAARLYRASGDRIGVIRTLAAQAAVHHMEHHDQLAIATLRDVVADAADLGPTPEVAYAQSELARALMLAGAARESIDWCDRVLAHPEVAAPDVVLEALITKGTALTNEGREIEAEALLRGAVAIADARANVIAGLRARNNLRVLMHSTDLRLAMELTEEVRNIARKFGVRAWVLHGLASKMDVTFRLGTWEELGEDEQAELADGGEFYSAWAELEQRRRQVYRGDPREAEREFDAALATPVISNSAQATTWNLAAKADALIPQGRFEEAFDLALHARASSAENELAHLAALFAAAGAADTGRLARVREALVTDGAERIPAGRGYLAVIDSLSAAIQRRWDESRAAMRTAEELLEGVGEGLVLGRFRLALGHLAADAFPEAGDAAKAGQAFFEGLGAGGYVAAYRAAAIGPVPAGARTPAEAVVTRASR